jgi:Ferritin-like domain
MTNHAYRPGGAERALTRRTFLAAAAATGAAAGALAGFAPGTTGAAAPARAGGCTESIQDLLNLGLTIELAATTFYYTGMTSKAVVSDPRLAGSSANPNAVARNGNPQNTANLQAALDQEQKHAQILANAGGVSSFRHFYFPASAFARLGHTGRAGTFLWVLDHLETACVAFYLAAVRRFAVLGRPDLAPLAVRNLAVECEHRALYRAFSWNDPYDNITLPVDEFTCASDAVRVFRPYLTGRGFPGRVTRAIGIPSRAQTAAVIGRNTSS